MLIKRVTSNGGNDIRTVYRPCTLAEFIGADNTKNIIENQLRDKTLSHTILITGPSGCGKTTMARVIALSLNCEENQGQEPCLKCNSCKAILNQNSLDYLEINVASANGKADTEAIIKDLGQSPFSSEHKIIVFDECHELTEAAKALLLKNMEDTYGHVYLIFCTNKPEALIDKKKDEENPFLDRCAHFVLNTLSEKELFSALENVCQFEGVPYTKEVLDLVVEASKGVPRRALKFLGLIISEGSWEQVVAKNLLNDVSIDEEDPEVMALSLALVKGGLDSSINKTTSLLKKHSPETIRVAVAGFFVYKLKKVKDLKLLSVYTKVLDIITVPIYQTGKAGEHVLYNYVVKTVLLTSKK